MTKKRNLTLEDEKKIKLEINNKYTELFFLLKQYENCIDKIEYENIINKINELCINLYLIIKDTNIIKINSILVKKDNLSDEDIKNEIVTKELKQILDNFTESGKLIEDDEIEKKILKEIHNFIYYTVIPYSINNNLILIENNEDSNVLKLNEYRIKDLERNNKKKSQLDNLALIKLAEEGINTNNCNVS